MCNVVGGRPSDVQEILNRLPATSGVVVNVGAPGLTEKELEYVRLSYILKNVFLFFFMMYVVDLGWVSMLNINKEKKDMKLLELY